MKRIFLMLAVLLSTCAFAQAGSPCSVQPTPGQPHVCLTFVGSTTPGAAVNIYRSTTSKGQDYSKPLNTTPLLSITLFFYDSTTTIGSTYFYTAAAVGTGGALSLPSPEVSAQIPVPPSSPTTLAATID